VRRVITGVPACVWAEVETDFSAVNPDAPPPRPSFVWLHPITDVADPKGLNPTPWEIGYAAINENGSEPRNRCAGS
jgi:hypothetical protein